MGESDRYLEYKQPRRSFSLGQHDNGLVNLIVVNIVFFMLLLVTKVIYFLFQIDAGTFQKQVVDYFVLPFSADVFFARPWTLLTYFFSNVGVFDLLGHMIWLYAFGSLLQSETGNRTVFPVFIYGGLVGGIFFLLTTYLFPALRGTALAGSGSAVVAVVVAATAIHPNHRFFQNFNGGIPVWVFTLIYLLIDAAGLASYSAAFSVSHLAAALTGFLFIFLLRRGYDTGVWMSNGYQWFMHLFAPSPFSKSGTSKNKVFYNTGGRSPYTRKEPVSQQKIDAILDKIHQKGIEYLTEEEKQLLKKASENGF